MLPSFLQKTKKQKKTTRQQRQNPSKNPKQILSENVSGLSPSLVFGCMLERLGLPCPGHASLGLPPCPWHLPAGAAACPRPCSADGAMPCSSRCNRSTCLWGCGQQPPGLSPPSAAPHGLTAPVSSAGPGSPASGCWPVGCAYRRVFPASFWLRGDPLIADKLPGLGWLLRRRVSCLCS